MEKRKGEIKVISHKEVMNRIGYKQNLEGLGMEFIGKVKKNKKVLGYVLISAGVLGAIFPLPVGIPIIGLGCGFLGITFKQLKYEVKVGYRIFKTKRENRRR